MTDADNIAALEAALRRALESRDRASFEALEGAARTVEQLAREWAQNSTVGLILTIAAERIRALRPELK